MIDLQSRKGSGSAEQLRYAFLLVFALLIGSVIGSSVNVFGLITVLFVLGLIVLGVVLVMPDLGLFLFLFLIYTNTSSVLIAEFGFPSIAKLLVPFMGIVILLRYVLFKDEYQGWVLPTILLGTYAIFGAFSLIYASNYEAASLTLSDYLKDALIGIVIILLAQKPSSIRVAVWSLIAAGFFLSVISLYQQFTGSFTDTFWGFATVSFDAVYGNRLGGSIGDPNYFAQILVILLPIAIDRAWNEKLLSLKFIASVASLSILITIFYTYSRGGFLALIGAGLMMVLLSRKRGGILIVGVFVLLAVYQLFPANYQDRILSLVNLLPIDNGSSSSTVDTSLQGRTSENLVAWSIFLDHPILGVGAGNYNNYYQGYARKFGLETRTSDRSAHNLFLEVAAERGLVGFFIFGVIVFFTLRQAFSSGRALRLMGNHDLSDMSIAFGVSFCTYLITAFFLHDAYPRFFWVLIGICWSFPQAVKYLKISQNALTVK